MRDVNASHELEQLARDVLRSPDAGRCHIELAWIGLGISHKLRTRLGGNRWVNQHNLGLTADGRDRRDVANEVEIELVVDRGSGCVPSSDQEKRVTVRLAFD